MTLLGKKPTVIWNPAASSASNYQALQSELQKRNFKIVETRDASHALAATREAIANGSEGIVIAGGDGTVSAISNAVFKTKPSVVLGILPLGTGNDLARTLNIPLDPTQALELFAHGEKRRLDLVAVASAAKENYLVNVATGGNPAEISDKMSDEQKKFWGAFAYVRNAVHAVAERKHYKLELDFGSTKEIISDVFAVIVANGQTSGGGFRVAPMASLDDGLLDLIVVRSTNLLDVAAVTARLLLGDYVDHEQVYYRRVAAVSITSEPSLLFSTDGELVHTTPTSFAVRPAALSVIGGKTPATASGPS